MRRNLRRWAVATATALAFTTAAVALGGETDRARFHLGLGTHSADSPTGLTFRVLYRSPGDPAAKPPPLRSAVFRLPKGTRINTGAVPQCTASDEQIRALGRNACPPGSRVGGGRLVARTGTPGADRVDADIVAFNGPGELIEVVFIEGSNVVAGLDRLAIDRNVATAHPPMTPGAPPDGETAVRRIVLELPLRIGASGRPYAVTPQRCLRGRWKASATFGFADGGETTVPSRTRCERGSGA